MWCSGSCICLRDRGFESLWGHLYFLILARRGLYVGMRMGMRMSFAGKGNENGRIGNGKDDIT
jgi:hypothetical protein